MLENKITELKRLAEYKAQKELKGYNPALTPDPSPKINTSIDLNISAYIPDSYFGSSMDKMNFYRELETVENTEDLQTIIAEFQQINSELPPETQNLFALLKLKFIAGDYDISAIKKS
jgi:transcription-repair coupling factor (superfamily II helicase)